MVPYKGSVLAIIYQMCGGLRSSMGYCGCRTIDEMRNKACFVEITSAGWRESHVHDVRSRRKLRTTDWNINFPTCLKFQINMTGKGRLEFYRLGPTFVFN